MSHVRTGNIESNRLILFFLIAFSFTWLFWMPDALEKMGVIPPSVLTGMGFVGAFGPLVAALIVTAAYEGTAGVKALLLRAVDTRFAKQWWFVILLFLPALVLVALLMAATVDGAFPPSPLQAEPWMIFPVFFAVLLTSGPLEEEFGWRGYALPRLQAKYSALASSLILGFMWAAWHIPQFLIPNNGLFYKTPIWTFVITVIATAIIFTWVYNNTNGSLLAMLVLHATFNLSTWVSAVLDTSVGYISILSVFAMAALLVLGVFGCRDMRRTSASSGTKP